LAKVDREYVMSVNYHRKYNSSHYFSRVMIKIISLEISLKQDTCSNEHKVCPMPLHKYEAQ